MNLACRICSNNGSHAVYRCREGMFGWGDEFQYFQCVNCGCLQIASVPADLSRFYPPGYYSFHVNPFPQRGWKSKLAAARDFSAATGTSVWGELLGKLTPARSDLASLAEVPASPDMHILDMGCGRGQLLSILHRAGFTHLFGIDPYLEADIEVLPGLRVCKQSLEQTPGQFDLIMLHHVFEHIESGREILETCRRRLTPEGRVLLRFPTAESEAWIHYRQYWVQLDAPRHLFLHSIASFQILAMQAGLKIEKWKCDSSGFQFWGSELYRKGLSLYNSEGIAIDPTDHFSKVEMHAFDERAKLVNINRRGDQVVVVCARA